jgi:membrane protein required for colicin V production
LFKDVVKTENLALFFGFFTVFLVTLLAGFLAVWLATKFVKFAKLQWFDRCLGAAFGFIRGWVLGSVLFLGLTSFDVQADRVRSSQFAPYLLPGARVIALFTPEDLKARFLVGYQAVEKWWRENRPSL